jgi:hypothetical protein
MRWKAHGVERPQTITPGDHVLGRKILHRKAKRVKLHRTSIVSSKVMNRYEILNNIGCDKNIIKVEWAGKGRVTY